MSRVLGIILCPGEAGAQGKAKESRESGFGNDSHHDPQ